MDLHSIACILAGLLLATIGLTACNPHEPLTPVTVATNRDQTPNPAVDAKLVVGNWGPRRTSAGIAFNKQADGNSGVSFELDRPAPTGEFAISFDGKPLQGVVVSGTTMTATIPLDYLTRPGAYRVVLENFSQGIRVEVGDFTVEAP